MLREGQVKRLKQLLLAGTAVLALAASQPAAQADPIVFDYSGSLVPFTVPTTDTYQIIAFGAQGGSATSIETPTTAAGGNGAKIGGNFVLTAGENLNIAVGGAGGDCQGQCAGAGGGGSFVVTLDNEPLIIAGGGGGATLAGPCKIPGLGV
jgi:Glycine rich protein